jgi:hypothetical protein
MSTINPGNNLQFTSADAIFAKVKRRLSSYDKAGLLDEGEWYDDIRYIIDSLGISAYEEKQAIVMIKNYRAPRPEDFSYLYSAYKCTSDYGTSKQTVFPQTGFVFYIDETHEPYRQCKNCLSAKRDFIEGEKITIRTYIEGQPQILSFNNRVLLELSSNAKNTCSKDSPHFYHRCANQITIDRSTIYTNFEEGAIDMKYYALALDPVSGLPLVPDDTFILKAIEDYIVFRQFQVFYENNSVPDMENRYKEAKIESDNSLDQARHLSKLPSFQTMINKIRADRNNLRIYQQIR